MEDCLVAWKSCFREVILTPNVQVRVNDNIWCMMDGGEWKDCKEGHEVKDLVEEIESLYKPDAAV